MPAHSPHTGRRPPMSPSAGRITREPVLVFAALMVLFKLLHLAGSTGRQILGVVVPVAWVYVPVWLLLRGRHSFADHALTTGNWRRDLRTGLLTAAVILPLFVLGFYVYHGAILGKTIEPEVGWWSIWMAVTQILVIAYPEEIFFRGYMQTRLNRVFTGRWKVLGTPVGLSVVATSVLFAIGHFVIQPHPGRLAVFFPSLVFGWLRERTGSVVAPGIFHGLANITILVLVG